MSGDFLNSPIMPTGSPLPRHEHRKLVVVLAAVVVAAVIIFTMWKYSVTIRTPKMGPSTPLIMTEQEKADALDQTSNEEPLIISEEERTAALERVTGEKPLILSPEERARILTN